MHQQVRVLNEDIVSRDTGKQMILDIKGPTYECIWPPELQYMTVKEVKKPLNSSEVFSHAYLFTYPEQSTQQKILEKFED